MEDIIFELDQIGREMDKDKWSRERAPELRARLISLRQRLEDSPEDDRFFINLHIFQIDQHIQTLVKIHGREQ